MKVHIVLLSFLLIFVSCGRKEGVTPTTISFNLGAAIDLQTSGNNGAKFFGSSDRGDNFLVNIPVDGRELVLPLRNGTWKFYAMTWEKTALSTTAKFTGLVRCAHQAGLQLTGGEIALNMDLSNANCAETAVYGLNYSYDHDADTGTPNKVRFAQLKYMPIQDNVTINGIDNCTVNGVNYNPCGASFSNVAGVARLYQLVVPNFHFESGQFLFKNIIAGEDSCADVATDGYASLGGTDELVNLNIPESMPAILNVGYDGTCDTGFGVSPLVSEKISYLNGGVVNHSSDFIQFRMHAPVLKKIYLYHRSLPQYVCGGTRGTGSEPVGGRTTAPKQPIAICNPDQFNSLGDDHMAANIVLMKDLVMDLGDQSLVSADNVFPDINFKPIGISTIGESSDVVTVTPTAQAYYSGTFDGRGHTLYGLRFHARNTDDNISQMGLFTYIGYGANVKNLNIEDLSLEIENANITTMGGLAGKCFAIGTVENIKIQHGQVRNSRDKAVSTPTGGIIGDCTGQSTISTVRAIGLRIEGTMNVGGILGRQQGGTAIVDKAYFNGSIEAVNNIGGIVGGMITSGTEVSNSHSLGTILLNGNQSLNSQNVGGVVGNMGDQGVIANSYSQVLITAKGQDFPAPINVGGLAGSCPGTTGCGITHSLSFGSILLKCSSNDSSCMMGDMFGGDTSYLSVTQSGSINTIDHFNLGGIAGVEVQDPAAIYTISNGNDFDETFQINSTWNTEWTNDWGFHDGYGPFLLWEADFNKCLESPHYLPISDQITGGLGGSPAQPISICSTPQFIQMMGNANDRHYKMINPLFLGSLPEPDDTSFNGSFDGLGLSIIGGEISSNNSIMGLFREIGPNGVVKDFNLINFNLEDGNFDYATGSTLDVETFGIIAGVNRGLIEDVNVIGGSVVAKNFVGAVAGENHGVIRWSNAEEVQILASTYVGGIAGKNYGVIEKSESRAQLFNSTEGPQLFYSGNGFGGIAGLNDGVISQTHYAGLINLESGDAASQVSAVGGLAGVNAANGRILDSYVGDYNENDGFRTMIDIYFAYDTSNNTDVSNVGGIVGFNMSNYEIQNVYSIAKTDIDTSVDGSYILDGSIGPMIGDNSSGNGLNAKSFYLHQIEHWKKTHVITASDSAVSGATDVSVFGIDFVTGETFTGLYIDHDTGSGGSKDYYDVSTQAYSAGPSLNVITLTAGIGTTGANGESLIFLTTQESNTLGLQATEAELKLMDTFCDDDLPYNTPSSTDPFTHDHAKTKCSSGWDMSQEFSGGMIGSARVIQWHFYHMGLPGYTSPGDPPIWTLEKQGQEFPRLMQLKKE